MSKRLQKPFPALYPVPVTLITCLGSEGEPNVFTASWVGTVSSSPPQVAISVRPYRYSHVAIEQTGEFVINIPDESLLRAVDVCGHISKARADKFAMTGLTLMPASQLKTPLVAECPVNIECQVVQKISLDSHDLFVSKIIAVHVDEALLDEAGFIDYSRTRPIAYLGNEYWGLGQRLNTSGFFRRETR
ncbi:MAG: flavin reductase family protein [Anaerolineae bacterium]|jgi:flavin reductase (DIM6/NTAB) family NADH-FMN oxidoreductase RutF|nr:flavin reductase family protein [Anaerolineae bacterium]MDH7475639.1 flavin reductase family protein [Anaerolineae bacterium]